jgi:hypothetical protein
LFPFGNKKRQPPKKLPKMILMQLLPFCFFAFLCLFAFKFPRSGLVQLIDKSSVNRRICRGVPALSALRLG